MFGTKEKRRGVNIPNDVDHDPLQRLKDAVDELNAAWANVPKPYRVWMDWDHKPPRVVIINRTHIERNVVHPQD